MNSNKEMIRNLVDMANGLIGDAVYFVDIPLKDIILVNIATKTIAFIFIIQRDCRNCSI